jgi:hypothetical protein
MRRKLAFPLFILFLILIVIGIRMGEFGATLEKAITVCLACIGIG